MKPSTFPKMYLLLSLILFAGSTAALARSRRPARSVDTSPRTVVPASTVLDHRQLARVAIALHADPEAISRVDSATRELRRRGAVGRSEQVIGWSQGRALTIDDAEAAALRAMTGIEILTGE